MGAVIRRLLTRRLFTEQVRFSRTVAVSIRRVCGTVFGFTPQHTTPEMFDFACSRASPTGCFAGARSKLWKINLCRCSPEG